MICVHWDSETQKPRILFLMQMGGGGGDDDEEGDDDDEDDGGDADRLSRSK